MEKQQQILKMTSDLSNYQKQGNWHSYMDTVESLHSLKREINTDEEIKILNKIRNFEHKQCVLLNQQGIMLLKKQEYAKSLRLLKKAEQFASNSKDLKVTTYNNLACYYRRTGKIRIALTYLQNALQIQLTQPKQTNLSDTYLNLCAVYSQLDKHDDALNHIFLSIIILQHELLYKSLPFIYKENQDRIAIMVVAYHNLAVELEYFKKQLESMKIYSAANHFAQEYLPQEHIMRKNLQKITEQYQNMENIEQLNFVLPSVSNNNKKSNTPTPYSIFNKTNQTSEKQKIVFNQSRLKMYIPQITSQTTPLQSFIDFTDSQIQLPQSQTSYQFRSQSMKENYKGLSDKKKNHSLHKHY